MGSLSMMLSVFAVVLVISYTEAASGSCPLPSKVYSCSPKCQQNYDCSHGKVCCSNSCNAKSCTEPAPYGSAANDKQSQSEYSFQNILETCRPQSCIQPAPYGSAANDKQPQSGAGIYCANVKCNAFEVCKTDPSTKRQKCARP